MQMSLACQATQKNALMAAIQQAAFYDIPGTDSPGDAKVSLYDGEARGMLLLPAAAARLPIPSLPFPSSLPPPPPPSITFPF